MKFNKKKKNFFKRKTSPILAIKNLYFYTVFYLISVRHGSDNMTIFILISFLIWCLNFH